MRHLSEYLLPAGNVQIAFSGGRTSAYMLHQILDANGNLPDRVVVSFQNTGREMPETLDFVQECATRWGVQVVWLEWRDAAIFGDRYEIVSHNSASRDGEPFAGVIRKRGYLPNRVSRFCTAELKVHTATRFCRDGLGWKRWTAARGLRADEPARLTTTQAKKPRERWTTWHPLADAGVTVEDVTRFWSSQPFDLRLPNTNGRTFLGNCDGCFLKSEEALSILCREHPDRAQWWEEQERELAGHVRQPNGALFNEKRSMKELIDWVVNQQDWIFDTEGALCQADHGECFE